MRERAFDLRALPRDAARAVRATRRRLNLALVLGLAARAAAAVTFGAGAAVLTAKVLAAPVFPGLLSSSLGVDEPLWPAVLAVAGGALSAAAAYLVMRLGHATPRLYTDREAAVLYDVAGGGGSLSLALAERADDPRLRDWQGSVQAARRPPVRMRPLALLRPLALPAAFLAGALLVPGRTPEVRRRGHALRRAVERAEETAEALAEAELLRPEELEDLREELDDVSAADREADARAWEGVDSVDERLSKKVQEAADAAAWAMRAVDSLAEGPTDEARRNEAEAALGRLAKTGMLDGLPEALASTLGTTRGGACKLPSDPRELARILKELDPLLASGAKKLARSCRGSGQAGTEQALSDLAAYCDARIQNRMEPGLEPGRGVGFGRNGDRDVQWVGPAPDGDGFPGSGGINRGRGDAAMIFGEPCDEEGAAFKLRELPPGFQDPESAHTIATWLGEPDESGVRAGGRTGAGAARDVGEASGRARLSPARRELVRRYFGPRSREGGKTDGR